MSDDLVRQPALRRWQESVYGNGPYQVPDYESMAAIVQEHEQMAVRIEELEDKLAKAVEMLAAIIDDNDNGMFVQDHTIEIARTTLAKLAGLVG